MPCKNLDHDMGFPSFLHAISVPNVAVVAPVTRENSCDQHKNYHMFTRFEIFQIWIFNVHHMNFLTSFTLKWVLFLYLHKEHNVVHFNID